MELRKKVRVLNDQGLHARPCHSIVSRAQGYQSELWFRNGANPEVNGKSIIQLMTLGASVGTELEVRVSGADAENLLTEIESLFASGFDES